MPRSGTGLVVLAMLPLAACAQLPFELPSAAAGGPSATRPTQTALVDPATGIPIPTPKPTPGVPATAAQPQPPREQATASAPARRPAVVAKAGDTLSGEATVVDGDTLMVEGAQVELLGIDAPEAGQTCQAQRGAYECGQQATTMLTELVGDEEVDCSVQDVDLRDRAVATCVRNGVDLSRQMARDGWAVASYGYAARYVADERQASGARRGIWQGRFDMPWDWRAGIRTASTTPGASG